MTTNLTRQTIKKREKKAKSCVRYVVKTHST